MDSEVVEGMNRVPDGFTLITVEEKPRSKKAKAKKATDKKLPSYARANKSATRRNHRRKKKKLKRQPSWQEDVRHAAQIGGSKAHADAGVGMHQHADNKELHRRLRESKVLKQYEKQPTVHIPMGHLSPDTMDDLLVSDQDSNIRQCAPLPAISFVHSPSVSSAGTNTNKHAVSNKKRFALTNFEQERQKWRREVRARFEARMRAHGLWAH